MNKIILLAAPLIALIFISGCLEAPNPHETKCKTSCEKKGFSYDKINYIESSEVMECFCIINDSSEKLYANFNVKAEEPKK